MAGRSNSLSINTGGSLFGANNASQGQQSAGLFGSAAASSQPQTGGLFSSTATSQPQTGGLFGNAASQPPPSGGLFGASAQTSQPQTGGLFGNLNKPATTGASGGLFGGSAASQPQQGGSLFGGALGASAQNQTQNQSQNQTTSSQSGGLFSLGQPPKPSLFGSSTTQQNTAPSLFGNKPAAQAQGTAPSLFGSTQQNQPQAQQPSLFGGMASQNLPGQTSQQAIQINSTDNLRGTTRFGELHPEFQRAIEELDNTFQHHMSNAAKVRGTLPQQGDNVANVAPDVAYVEQLLQTVELGIENDSDNIAHLKQIVQGPDVDNLKLCIRAIENQKLPQQFHYGNRSNLNSSTTKHPNNPATVADDEDDPTKPVDLVSYFSKRSDDLSRTLSVYQNQIREIEAHLRTMEYGTVEKEHQLTGSRSSSRDQIRELVEALRAIEVAILESAKKVGGVRDRVSQQTLGSVGGGLL